MENDYFSSNDFLTLTGSPSGPVTFDASWPFSPTTTSNSTISPSPTLRTALRGLLREMAVFEENYD